MQTEKIMHLHDKPLSIDADGPTVRRAAAKRKLSGAALSATQAKQAAGRLSMLAIKIGMGMACAAPGVALVEGYSETIALTLAALALAALAYVAKKA